MLLPIILYRHSAYNIRKIIKCWLLKPLLILCVFLFLLLFSLRLVSFRLFSFYICFALFFNAFRQKSERFGRISPSFLHFLLGIHTFKVFAWHSIAISNRVWVEAGNSNSNDNRHSINNDKDYINRQWIEAYRQNGNVFLFPSPIDDEMISIFAQYSKFSVYFPHIYAKPHKIHSSFFLHRFYFCFSFSGFSFGWISNLLDQSYIQPAKLQAWAARIQTKKKNGIEHEHEHKHKYKVKRKRQYFA